MASPPVSLINKHFIAADQKQCTSSHELELYAGLCCVVLSAARCHTTRPQMTEWLNTCCEVEHIEVWREVVSDVPSGQMVQVGFMKKLPTIPDDTGEKSHDLTISVQHHLTFVCFIR